MAELAPWGANEGKKGRSERPELLMLGEEPLLPLHELKRVGLGLPAMARQVWLHKSTYKSIPQSKLRPKLASLLLPAAKGWLAQGQK